MSTKIIKASESSISLIPPNNTLCLLHFLVDFPVPVRIIEGSCLKMTKKPLDDARNKFLDYVAGNENPPNNFSKVSEFWKQKELNSLKSINKKFDPDVNNLRASKGRRAMGNGGDDQGLWHAESLWRVQGILPPEFANNIKESDFGSPEKFHSIYGETSGMFLLNLYQAYVINNYIQKYSPKTSALDICEIGAGWGQCCEILSQIHDINSYTTIDLDFTLYLSYLNGVYNYTEKHTNLMTEERATKKYNYIIPQKIDCLKNKKYDIFINCFSLQEMSVENVEAYINLIYKQLRDGGIFISINHHGRAGVQRGSQYNFQKFKILDIDKHRRDTAAFAAYQVCVKKDKKSKTKYDADLIDRLTQLIVEIGPHTHTTPQLRNLREELLSQSPYGVSSSCSFKSSPK